MKNLILSMVMFLALSAGHQASAQNVAVGLHTGVSAYIANTSIGIPIGVNAEWAFDTDHSFAAKAHYNIGIRTGDVGFFYISPEYKYHVTGESLDGFYIGAYMGFGGGNGSGYISLGAVTGYSFPIGEKFNLEANVQVGYGNFTIFRTHVLHLVPTFGARYTF